MLAVAKLLMLSFATIGVVAVGAVAHIPLEKAIDIHKDHLSADSGMPTQSTKGQQNALDHLQVNQERWLADHPVPEETLQNDTAVSDLRAIVD